MKTFPLQVLKINQEVYVGDAVSVTVPGSSGELTILAKHETILTSLRSGKIVIKKQDSSVESIEISQGFLEATKDKVTVLL